jgi:hypothetical protein
LRALDPSVLKRASLWSRAELENVALRRRDALQEEQSLLWFYLFGYISALSSHLFVLRAWNIIYSQLIALLGLVFPQTLVLRAAFN